MRKWLVTCAMLANAALVAPAFAIGGEGTINHIRQQNENCDLQRRGVIPRYPSVCLPELPPGPAYDPRAQERR